MKEWHNEKKYGKNPEPKPSAKITLSQIDKCPQDQGMIDYLNEHTPIYHVNKVNKTWQPCTDINYDITP